MDVILIQAPKLAGLKASRGTIPVSLLYLSSYLRKYGHKPHILDFSALRIQVLTNEVEIFWEYCREKIMKTGAGLIGINCFSTMHFLMVKDIAEKIKKSNPKIKICLGGCHPTFFAEDIMTNCECFDYIVLGEGESQLVALADMLENAVDEEVLANIQALTYKDNNGNVVVNPRQNYLENLASLPMPAWDLLNISDYYSDHSRWYNPKQKEIKLGVPIVTSRSCPFNCSFCSAYLLMGKKYRKRPPVDVVDEIELLNKKYGQNYFTFIDDNINLQKAHVIEICKEICDRELDIQFAISQGLYVSSVDENLVEILAAAGCVTVSLPIESGSDYIRNSVIGKKLSSESISYVVECLKEKEIFTVGLFIMGFPEETIESLNETIGMIKDLALDVNAVSTLIPFPGTKIYDQAKRDDLLLFDTEELWLGDMVFDPQCREQFFLQPYNLELDKLAEYRKKFDDMYFYSQRAKALNL